MDLLPGYELLLLWVVLALLSKQDQPLLKIIYTLAVMVSSFSTPEPLRIGSISPLMPGPPGLILYGHHCDFSVMDHS